MLGDLLWRLILSSCFGLLGIIFFVIVVLFLLHAIVNSCLHLLLLEKHAKLLPMVTKGFQVAVAHEDFYYLKELAN